MCADGVSRVNFFVNVNNYFFSLAVVGENHICIVVGGREGGNGKWKIRGPGSTFTAVRVEEKIQINNNNIFQVDPRPKS